MNQAESARASIRNSTVKKSQLKFLKNLERVVASEFFSRRAYLDFCSHTKKHCSITKSAKF